MRPNRYNTRTKHDLSDRQREVLGLIASGKTNREIAETLDITLDGAKFHVSEILRKLRVDSREEAAEWWKQHRSSRERMPGWLGWSLGAGLGGAAAVGLVVVVIAAVLQDREDQAATLVSASASPTPVPTEESTQFTIIDWAPFVKFEGITYHAVDHGAIPLGPEYRKVEAEMPSSVEGPWDYLAPVPDGSAAHVPEGTWVHEVEGYSPSFRLAARVNGHVQLFEVGENPNASSGRELLDIEGKVDSITIWSNVNRHEAGVTRIDDPVEVERLVEMVLGAPAGESPRDVPDDWRPLDFRLRDGSRFAATFSPSSGYLSPGLQLPPEFNSLVEVLAPP